MQQPIYYSRNEYIETVCILIATQDATLD